MEGPFDIIGDVHGCYDELLTLLDQLGYELKEDGDIKTASHPDGRLAVFLGDLVDRGPGIVNTLKIVMGMVRDGNALCVAGNHDNKLLRYLKGHKVTIAHGLEESVAQLKGQAASFVNEVRSFLEQLPSHYILDHGRLVVAHAGIKKDMIGKKSREVQKFTLYGEVTGETDEHGLPVRGDWAMDYDGDALIVYGHTPMKEVYIMNKAINIDTGCVFGNKLTALRYPEMKFVSVKALKRYYNSLRFNY